MDASMAVLSAPPFTIGGDPRVHASDFRMTTFATGLDFPTAMVTLSDGSLLVTTNPFFGLLYPDNRSLPVLVCYLSYFGLMFLALRWWKIVHAL